MQLGIRPVRDIHKEKVRLHKARVDAEIAQRNHEAHVRKLANDNRLIREREAEDQRLYEQACIRMANSAFHIDQLDQDTARRRRLAAAARNQRKREQRDAVVEVHASTTQGKSPKSPLGGAMFVGANAVVDYVDREKVAAAMIANTRVVRDQLADAKLQRKQISAVILEELADTVRMFPRLLSSPQSSPAAHAVGKFAASPGRPATSGGSRARPAPFSPAAAAAAAAVRGMVGQHGSSGSPWHDPLHDEPPASASGVAPPATAQSAHGLAPSSSDPRPHRPQTSSGKKKQLHELTGLSTRFDSPAVPLPASPGLPPLLDCGVYNM